MTTYVGAGVNLAESERLTEWLAPRIGSLFGGMVPAGVLKTYDDPMLVTSIDGVGTKARLARILARVDGLGQDIVHHCVNDIAVHGAIPLLFMDYLAFNHLDEALARTLISSIQDACAALGMPLASGETAEMGLVYRDGEFDVAGSIVGVVERTQVVDGSAIRSGDVVLGLDASGLHTNGFSLIQSLFGGNDYDEIVVADGQSLADFLLEPHRCYLHDIRALVSSGLVHGLAHITGGGIEGNVGRIIPEGLCAEIEIGARPAIYDLIESRGVSRDEMARVFNLGVGLVAICDPAIVAEPGWESIGQIRTSTNGRRVWLTL